MKIGYSILLSEYQSAIESGVKDCERYQIVCPSCYEPVFLVTRDGVEDLVTYFSHYNKSKSYTSDCELRVENSNEDERYEHNRTSREQKLKYFLSVFGHILREDPLLRKSKARTATLNNMKKSKAWQQYRTLFFNQVRDEGWLKFETSWQSASWEAPNLCGFESSELCFSSTQGKIGHDVLKMLTTPHCKKNFDLLFDQAASRFHVELSKDKSFEGEEALDDDMKVAVLLGSLFNLPHQEEMLIYLEGYLEDRMEPFYDGGEAILGEMVFTALRLPYLKFLKLWSKRRLN